MTPEAVASGFHEIQRGDVDSFEWMAVAAEAYQRALNPVYARLEGYRYLPIEAFKRAAVCTFEPTQADAVFRSSGTGGRRSVHYVRDLDLYRRSVLSGFRLRFGNGPFVIAAHLPGYAQDSSLVAMLRILMASVGTAGSDFFLDNLDVLERAVSVSRASGYPLMLFGVAFGLLDLVDTADFTLPDDTVIVETGGMKTRRRAIHRSELHERLRTGFGVRSVTSEYGMCELLSQCWMDPAGSFRPPPWMSFDVLDPADPRHRVAEGEEGVLAVFDLANLYSVSAILTEDRAVRTGTGFDVLGRLSGAELRGCNLLLEDLGRGV